MIISHIVAASKNLVIGRENDLPWSLPDDMNFFKRTTKNHHVLLGRKNYESLPEKWRPLPHRVNVVVTRNKGLKLDGAIVANSIEEGIEVARLAGEDELFIIGGGEIYNQSMDVTNRIYITEIDAEIDGDTYYPEIDKDTWQEVSSEFHPVDEKHAFSFTFKVYERRKIN